MVVAGCRKTCNRRLARRNGSQFRPGSMLDCSSPMRVCRPCSRYLLSEPLSTRSEQQTYRSGWCKALSSGGACMATNLQATCDAEVTTDESAHSELNKTGPKPLTEQHPLNSSAQSSASQRPEELASLLHAEVSDPVKLSTSRDRHVPWLAWPLLVASLIAFSSAAVVFASLPDVPTCTLAAWRLQLTTFLLTPAAVYQFLHLPAGIAVEVDDNLCFGISAQCLDAQMMHIVCTCHQQ